MELSRHVSGAAGLLLFSLLTLVGMILWLADSAVSLAETGEERPPNIVFVIVDSLRPDHVSAYGYQRDTTPNVDTWVAEQGALFTDVTAASSWTNPANGAMLTSHTPSSIDTVWTDLNGRIPEDEVLLAEYLHDAGYVTAGFVSNWWLQARFGYAQGFDKYVSTAGPDKTRAHVLNDIALEWMDENLTAVNSSNQPLFLFLYYLDPHSWYDPPSPYDIKYDSTYTGTLTAERFGHGRDVVSGDVVPSERDIEHLLALYDGEINYWDFELGEIFTYLENKGVLENSIIVVTSDHGEMFGEHNKWVHGNSLYEEVLRIPLLISYPGEVAAGQKLTAPVHMMDITPTLLEMIGLPLPLDMDGQSLLPLMRGAASTEDRLIVSEMSGETNPDGLNYWIAPHTPLFSIKKDGWKLIHTQQAPQLNELYEMQDSSPYEGENVNGQEPQLANELYGEMKQFFGVPDQFLFMPIIERN